MNGWFDAAAVLAALAAVMSALYFWVITGPDNSQSASPRRDIGVFAVTTWALTYGCLLPSGHDMQWCDVMAIAVLMFAIFCWTSSDTTEIAMTALGVGFTAAVWVALRPMSDGHHAIGYVEATAVAVLLVMVKLYCLGVPKPALSQAPQTSTA